MTTEEQDHEHIFASIFFLIPRGDPGVQESLAKEQTKVLRQELKKVYETPVKGRVKPVKAKSESVVDLGDKMNEGYKLKKELTVPLYAM